MTAAIASNTSLSGEGLRHYDARRDMTALAELIEAAFGDRLDRSGERLIREMRLLGKAGWFGWLLSRWLLPPAANPHGFVWETDGKVVGNASLLPVEHYRHRWVIANVAVLPEHRGQGIAGRLVEAGIDFACRRGARTLILQVDSDNEQALSLYRRRGFQTTATRTIWTAHRTPRGLGAIDRGKARPRQMHEWRAQWMLAKRLHPEGLIWPYPTVSTIFRPKSVERWTSIGAKRHWVWKDGDRLIGSLSMRYSNQPGVWRIILIIEPDYRGDLEAPLLASALEGYRGTDWGFVLEYPQCEANPLLGELGFSSQRTLTWMSKSVKRQVPGDTGRSAWS